MTNSPPDQPLEQIEEPSQRLFYSFRKVEEAQTHLSANYSSVNIQSQDKENFDLMCTAAIFGNVAFTNNISNSGLHIEFDRPFDGYGMTLPASGSMLLHGIKGDQVRSLSNGGLLVDSLNVRSAEFSSQASWRRIMMPSQLLHDHIAVLTERQVHQRVHFAPHFEKDSIAAQSIFAIEQVIVQGMRGDAPLLKAAAALASLRDAVLSLFVESMPNSYSELLSKPAAAPAPRHIKRAIEFMHTHLLAPLQLDDIARAAGTSPRSLQTGFRNFRNTTPMQFLRTLRIEGAHHDLANSPPGTTVAEVAYRWGFSHHGLFAARYMKIFGQSPSMTLKMSQKNRYIN